MGALDDTPDIEDGSQGDATDGVRWIQGTSRDLFRPSPPDSVPISKDSDETEAASEVPNSFQLAADEHADEVLNGTRLDGRDEVLPDYKLDAVSEELAHQIGRDLADAVSIVDWEGAKGSISERLRMVDDSFKAIAPELVPDAAAPIADFDSHELGWSKGKEVHYNVEQIGDDSPQRLMETLLHEYRHVWQGEVMTGVREHPLGESGRRAFLHAVDSYEDEVDSDAYAGNALELDAEKFARHAFASYTWVCGRES